MVDVGGLIVSQALTLFTTPVIYLYLDKLSNWMSPPSHAATPDAPEEEQPYHPEKLRSAAGG